MFEDILTKIIASATAGALKTKTKASWEFLRKTSVHWGGRSSEMQRMIETAKIRTSIASARIAEAKAGAAEAETKVAQVKADNLIKQITAGTEAPKETAQSFIEQQQLLFQGLPPHEQEKQLYKAQIINKAINVLPPDATEENIRNMDNDWLGYLFKQCDIISNEEMQSLWAKILAGEASKPGSFSKKTVSIISTMDKTDAQMFTNFCQFVWHDESHAIPLIHNYTHEIYQPNNHMFDTLEHLRTIGLLSISSLLGYGEEYIQPTIIMSYFGRQVHLTAIEQLGAMYMINIGKVIMTQMGQQLAPICGAQANDKFFQYIIDKWHKDGLNPQLRKS